MISSVSDEFKDDFDLSDLGLGDKKKKAPTIRSVSSKKDKKADSAVQEEDSDEKIIDLALVGEFLGIASEPPLEDAGTKDPNLAEKDDFHLSPKDFLPEASEDSSYAGIQESELESLGGVPLFNFDNTGSNVFGEEKKSFGYEARPSREKMEEGILDIEEILAAPVLPRALQDPGTDADIFDIEDLLADPGEDDEEIEAKDSRLGGLIPGAVFSSDFFPAEEKTFSEGDTMTEEGEKLSDLVPPEQMPDDAEIRDMVAKRFAMAASPQTRVSEPDLESMVEKTVRKVLTERIDAILVQAVEKAVEKKLKDSALQIDDEEP